MKIVREEPTLQETENYVREIDRRRGEIMKRMETNAITKEIERRLVRIMEKVGLFLGCIFVIHLPKYYDLKLKSMSDWICAILFAMRLGLDTTN